MIDLAIQHGIHLFCLPPHTTHRLQPLDVGVFGPLQIAWFERCDAILENTGQGMQLRDVVKEYMAARNASFKPETILQAWRKSGINPHNPGLFTEADFAPSHSTSIRVHAPSTFPLTMPRVPDASSDNFFDPTAPYEDDFPSSDNSDADWSASSSDSETSSSSDSDDCDDHTNEPKLVSPTPIRKGQCPDWLD